MKRNWLWTIGLSIGVLGIGFQTPAQEFPVQAFAPLDQANNIRQYLMREAAEVTRTSLDGIASLEDWQAVREERRAQLAEMLSLTDVPLEGERPPLNVKITGEIQQDGFRIVKLWYESLPDLYVPANLYIPDNLDRPAPAVLYVCGHARNQKVNYQAHPRKLAQLGFVTLIIETIQWGEVRGVHWGAYSEGFFHWYSRGYTPGGVETWNALRGLDLLASREEVNAEKMGVTGISGGGAYSWYVAALDERIDAAAPVCGTGTVEDHIFQRTIDGHCDCMMPINTYQQDVHDMGALIAPRPLLVASANRDGLFSIESVRQSFENIQKIYSLYDAEEKAQLLETPGGHSYHEKSRTHIFSFFLKYLMGKNVPPQEVGDIDESDPAQLSEDVLRVYTQGPPAEDRTLSIQNSFQKMARPPQLNSPEAYSEHKTKVIEFLKEKTFGAFPDSPPALDLRLELRQHNRTGGSYTYSFVSEPGYRLKVEYDWRTRPTMKRNLLLVLKSPNEDRWDSNRFVSGLDPDWNTAFLETRGVGEYGWAPELQWHIRRAAAWTGRTIASMQVYDVLRGIQALRQLEGVEADDISIAARGDMAGIVLYAALLDGNIDTVLVQNPPATQNAPSSPDGRGSAIEMLNVLRITDVPQVAGLLHPTKVRFIGQPHANYNWAIVATKRLDFDQAVERVDSIADWQGMR